VNTGGSLLGISWPFVLSSTVIPSLPLHLHSGVVN